MGYTSRGRDNFASRVFSFGDFERSFGGLSADSDLSYAVQQFFLNGGSDAYIVRIPKHDAVAAQVSLLEASGSKTSLIASAISKGGWANSVIIDVDYDGIPDSDTESFNLTLTDLSTRNVEKFPNVTINSSKSNYVVAVIKDEDSGSNLMHVSVPTTNPGGRPAQTGTTGADIKLTDLKNDQNYKIKISSDQPPSKITNLDIDFINQGEDLPKSVLGVCRLLESKINLAIQKNVPEMTVKCVPSASGKGIRVHALFAGSPAIADPVITFAAGTPNDADTMLKLSGGTANVAHYILGVGRTVAKQASATQGSDGTQLPQTIDLIGNQLAFTGIYSLDKVDLFNILCIPDATRANAGNPNVNDSNVDFNVIFSEALNYCKKRRAFLLIDAPPEVNDLAKATDWISSALQVKDPQGFGATYFPRLRLPDPLNNFQLRTFAPCGVVAGLFARTDSERGVWKAPAGVDASLRGVQAQVYKLTDSENGVLNQLGLNCFRVFPVYGHIAWGSRTLAGADALASEWKYVPVRRLALFVEESLYRGLKWVVFEPNDEPLWAQIRLNIGAFMNNLFRQGAFQGKSPREAYLVKCDKETTTQNDINLGIVNIVVGFAPLKPAEFVIVKIQQLAGQIAV
ncbi:phage tail sheath family protein [Tolypothrix sp. NIES-4075]|uniref:phage tail sheath family protein n=1 Tax=Tolypothrix sp. NIES-4075 TaxID=2005459 RepID=UPI001F3653D7|nr:phage tail sheath C-terminal domain-containing protein [Tolypothrix sp. NIES-4075]